MSSGNVRQVWMQDMEAAVDELKGLSEKYPYIALNVMWAGIVARPICCHEYAYATVKDTVNLCEPLQIGLSFADAHGRTPNHSVQFNFAYHPGRTCLVQDAVGVLIHQGYDAAKAQVDGIDPQEFGEAMVGSGLITSEDIRWITYHGPYDLGFLYKLLSNQTLPDTRDEYIKAIADYFPYHYDVKYMLSRKLPRAELTQLGLRAACNAIGMSGLPIVTDPDGSCRAGFNAILVSICFFNSLKRYFDNKLDDSKFSGLLYGLDDNDETKLPPGMLRLKPGMYTDKPPAAAAATLK